MYDMPSDNYSRWEEYDNEKEEWLASRPVCDECGEHIQDEHFYNIEGKKVCQECLDNYYKEIID